MTRTRRPIRSTAARVLRTTPTALARRAVVARALLGQRQRRETVERHFGTIKARMGAMHFLMKTLPRVAGEMALHVLAYNFRRVMNVVGSRLLIAAIRA